MSLEQVADDIKNEARARADEIRSEADERAAEIISEAEADAEELKTARMEAVEREIAQEREQAISGAKLEAKQERLEARRDILDEVRGEVEIALTELSNDKRKSFTKTLLESAATEFDDDAAVSVYARSEDQSLVEELLTEYEHWSFAGEYDCLGGVVVESETSRVRVKNTFDSVLDSVWDENLKDISKHLFDQ